MGCPWFSFTLRMRNVTTNMTSTTARNKNGTNQFGSFFGFNSSRLVDRSIYAVKSENVCKYDNTTATTITTTTTTTTRKDLIKLISSNFNLIPHLLLSLIILY